MMVLVSRLGQPISVVQVLTEALLDDYLAVKHSTVRKQAANSVIDNSAAKPSTNVLLRTQLLGNKLRTMLLIIQLLNHWLRTQLLGH